MASQPRRPSSERIASAGARIDPVFLRTAQFPSPGLARRLGCDELVVKVETLNPIGSFKGRGCDLLVGSMERGTSIVCASAGNFGQAVAYSARRFGLEATVHVAAEANPTKVERMRRLGARVVSAGRDFDEAKAHAQAAAERSGAEFVEDGARAELAEGAGTIALELTSEPEPFDRVLVPVGNGSLAIGIGRWLKDHSPSTRVVGVVATGAPSMARSFRAGRPVETDRVETIADGIAVRVPVAAAVAETLEVIDEMVEVEDGEIVAAMRLAAEELGLLVEPAGAAGLAALLADGDVGGRVAVPLCGGNLTPDQIREWIGAPA